MPTVAISGTDYEVYIDVATADDYLQADAQRAAAWLALTADQKSRNLVTATRKLDRMRWKGQKTSDVQPLAWPRDGVGVEGVVDGVTPQAVLDACAILAGDLALDASVADQANTGSNIKAVGAGSARVEFFKPTDGALLSPPLMELLRDLLAGQAINTAAGNFASGLSDCSSFPCPNPYGKTEGFG